MSREKSYGTTGLELDLTRDTARLIALVEDAAIARGAAVSAVMFHMAAIRSLHTKRPHGEKAAVQCVAARVQDRQGTDGYQAAHLVPGAIKVNGRDVWDLVAPTDGAMQRLQLQTKEAFAETRVLPAAANRADSQAEGDGSPNSAIKLKTLFGAQVQSMWMSQRFVASRPLAIDRVGVLGALSGWFDGLNRAYEAAALLKRQAGAVAADAPARERRALEATVLETYARSFKIVNVARFVEKEIGAVYHRYDWL
jgi:hypothetical protein